jgi:hypothetical protein
MKKYTLQTTYSFLIISFFVAGSVSAQGMMGRFYNQQGVTSTVQVQDTNIATALKDIFDSQNVSDQTKIDCSKVTDSQFEKLGDAYMGLGISEQQHTAMENMMGGEGSITLTQAHINMGRSYLGCWSNYKGGPSVISPMMGQYGVVSNQGYTYGNMMGWPTMMSGYYGGYGVFGIITTILFWVLLILGIFALIKWLRGNK